MQKHKQTMRMRCGRKEGWREGDKVVGGGREKESWLEDEREKLA